MKRIMKRSDAIPYSILCIIILFYILKIPQEPTCPASFQESVFKFTNKYNTEVGFSVRSNKMKESLISGDIDTFQIVYNEIYEQFEYFSTITDLPFYTEGLQLLKNICKK